MEKNKGGGGGGGNCHLVFAEKHTSTREIGCRDDMQHRQSYRQGETRGCMG